MHTASLTGVARHPATGAVVLTLGVTAASWALVHTSESAGRRAWNASVASAPQLFSGSGIPLAKPAPMAPVLATWSLQVSIGWTLTLLAWVAVCWVATAHQASAGRRWLPVTVGAFAVAAQCALALSPFSWLASGASWPGPVEPLTMSADGHYALTLHNPAALGPVVVLLALAGAAWWSARPTRMSTRPAATAITADRTATRRALVVVGVSALGLWLGALGALGATHLYDAPGAANGWVPAAVVEPGGSLLLLVVAGALISGAGRTATLVLVGAQIVVPASIWGAWPGGSPDLVVLLAWAMSAGATACAAAWRPTARALAELAAGPREVTMAPGIAES